MYISDFFLMLNLGNYSSWVHTAMTYPQEKHAQLNVHVYTCLQYAHNYYASQYSDH